jgi:hypothetical protein
MTTLDTILTALSLPITLAVPTVAIFASYRRARPYKVVGYSPAMGMVAVRWRDEPERTYWVTPATLQKGIHR